MRSGTAWSPTAIIGAWVLIFAVSLASGVSAQLRQPRPRDLTPQQVEALRTGIEDRANRVMIGFKPAAAAIGLREDGSPAMTVAQVQARAAELARVGVRVLRQFRRIPAVAAHVDPTQLETLLADPTIDYIEPEILYTPIGTSPAVFVQEIPWGISRVAAASAWSITRGAGAKLGIIDTGIDEDHPDLNPVGGINLVTGGTGRADWNDGSAICAFTHGTHVAGSAAALDNDDGVVGVAPDAELYALRVFDPESAGFGDCVASDFDIVAALEYAAANGFDVVNLSLGSDVPGTAMGDAVAATYLAGVVIVSAAGNSGSSVGFPAAFPQSFAVAAIDETDGVPGFSSHGPEVDIAAPGVRVLSTIGGGGLGLADGTSMATPHVAGVATLLRSARPDLSVEEIRSILQSTAADVSMPGFDEFAGHGVVQAGPAVQAVAGGTATLAVVPGDVEMTAASDGPVSTRDVLLRNVGAPGTIDWSVQSSAPWLSVAPASGSVTEAGASVTISADPTGLTVGFHSATLTFDATPTSPPFVLRVRMAVATLIPLDPLVAVSGELAAGERKRFALTGTAGQLIDVAVLTDFNHFAPLEDPVLRVFAPDGETVLAFNDDGAVAGLGTQSLVYAVQLPVDGTYLVEVGSFGDFFGGGFLVQARESGPILGLEEQAALMRTEEGGAPAEIVLALVNLTGVGTVGFTATPLAPWLSVDPSSGIASAGLVAINSDLSPGKDAANAEQRFGIDDYRAQRSFFARLESSRGARGESPKQGTSALLAVSVRVIADPAGLELGSHFGDVIFTSTDEWLSNTITFSAQFQIYTAGMQIISTDHTFSFGVATDSPNRGGAVATTSDFGGTLYPVAVDGTFGSPVTTEIGAFPGGVATGSDESWYVGSNRVNDPVIRRVTPDGTVSVVADVPDNVLWITAGPDDDVYGSAPFLDLIVRVSLDGQTVEAFGNVPFPVGLTYDPINQQFLVASLLGGVHRFARDGTPLDVIASTVGQPLSVASGSSGTIYVGDAEGSIWTVAPGSTSANHLAVAPGGDMFGLALVDGALIMSSFGQGEFFRFPVNDGPAGIPARDITVRLLTETVDVMAGDPVRIPVALDLSASTATVATYTATLDWDPAELDVTNVDVGDFTTAEGSFVGNDTQLSTGHLGAAAIEAVGRSGGLFTLFTLDATVNRDVPGGTEIPVHIGIIELGGPLGENFIPNLRIDPGRVCVDPHPFGDVTRNRTISGADAVQVLRHIVGLPLAQGSNIALGDVDGDGAVELDDAIQILRYLVDLPIPASSRIGRHTVGACG